MYAFVEQQQNAELQDTSALSIAADEDRLPELRRSPLTRQDVGWHQRLGQALAQTRGGTAVLKTHLPSRPTGPPRLRHGDRRQVSSRIRRALWPRGSAEGSRCKARARSDLLRICQSQPSVSQLLLAVRVARNRRLCDLISAEHMLYCTFH
ncbi:hypothetical protein SKAU_G00329240 [Synaphobranchus kaupii]|uniref:Uncharacterized protein n=1 Tax=Synaphobranchus kaupii TaxID=118154 RepID=A0A9Q1EQG2_SYNKA|nr:hypothetical protein SKAU_G00329240 [Synaphobranchus kaupii]